MSTITLGLLGSLLAGLATTLGAVPLFFYKKPSRGALDFLLGISAGIMLAATIFSLLIPAMDMGGILISVIGFALGALFLDRMDKIIPHYHTETGYEGPPSKMRKIWLFVLAITLHNFPEGMAVGVSFGSGNIDDGITIATAIGLQNIPEGLAVAAALISEGKSVRYGTGIAFLSGIVEPIGGLLGAAIVSIMLPMLPFFLSFAAGAMFFVISDEIIPETHKGGYERLATFGIVLGFIVMLILDNALG
ncbi:ZIP family metal transporter [Deferribacter thermophilus]|uniref:ZIP family metal transporter n=1 Tax=Deferribacter thermophilus TaxID=53573 RepID=UPI003C149876